MAQSKEVKVETITTLLSGMKTNVENSDEALSKMEHEVVPGLERHTKLQQFQLFISFGIVEGSYCPKYIQKSGLPELSAKAIIETLVLDGKGRELVSLMEKAVNEDLICEKSALIFALSQCARSSNLETKRAAYKLCPSICTTTCDLFLFDRYAGQANFNVKMLHQPTIEDPCNDELNSDIVNSCTDEEKPCDANVDNCSGLPSEGNEDTSKPRYRKIKASCWGRAHRTAISNWYKKRDPKQLAYEVVKQHKCRSWSHYDVVRLCHVSIKPDETDYLGNAVVLTYINKGLEHARKEYGKHQVKVVKETLEYLEQLESVRHSQTEVEVVKKILDHNISREFVPTLQLKSKQVWNALLRTMCTADLLDNITSFASFGHLNADSDVYDQALAKINGRDINVDPYKVYTAWKKYQKGDIGQIHTWTPDAEILSKLNSAFQSAIKNLGPFEQKVVVAINVRKTIDSDASSAATSSPIADIAALSKIIAKSHSKTDVIVFSTEAKEVRVKTSTKLVDVCSTIAERAAEIPIGSPKLSAPIQWAFDAKKEVDVFILYTDSVVMIDQPMEALREYREQVNKNARLVLCASSKQPGVVGDGTVRGVLDVSPFDYKVIPAVTRYVKMPDI